MNNVLRTSDARFVDFPDYAFEPRYVEYDDHRLSALLVASKYLAIELGPHNIRINSITANIPLSRIVTDEECTRSALFLVSDYSSGITGSVLDSNGGEALP